MTSGILFPVMRKVSPIDVCDHLLSAHGSGLKYRIPLTAEFVQPLRSIFGLFLKVRETPRLRLQAARGS